MTRFPRVIIGLAGPIRVRRVALLRSDSTDERLLGRYIQVERLIELDDAPRMSAITERSTLWHEWIHATLGDVGVKLADSDAERVCDAIAAGLTRMGVAPK